MDEVEKQIGSNQPAVTVTAKTALGIDENIEGLLCYIFGILTGILFLLLEKDNKFVRFHAIQSIATSIVVGIVLLILDSILIFIPIIGWVLVSLLNLSALVLWLLLMYKAFKKEIFKLPIVGDIAAQQARL